MNVHRYWIALCLLSSVVCVQCRSQANDSGTGSSSVIVTAWPPPPPADFGPCIGPEVAACLTRYSKPQMSSEDIQKLLDLGVPDCFALADPKKLERQGHCLPLTIGKDARNGQTIEVGYDCSDVCPDQGTIVLRYSGVQPLASSWLSILFTVESPSPVSAAMVSSFG